VPLLSVLRCGSVRVSARRRVRVGGLMHLDVCDACLHPQMESRRMLRRGSTFAADRVVWRALRRPWRRARRRHGGPRSELCGRSRGDLLV